jgi:hypothetical protein
MTLAATYSSPIRTVPRAAPRRPAMDVIRLSILWLAIYFSSIVLVDVLYNIFILLAIGAFVVSGLRIDRLNMPFIFFLVIYNLGGLISFQPYTDFDWSKEFVLGTNFVAITAIFYCFLMNEDAITRLNVCKSAFILGALQTSICGILGYFDVAGLGTLFSMYGRASGTFRDPNVFGPFLILPALYLLWDIAHGAKWMLAKVITLLHHRAGAAAVVLARCVGLDRARHLSGAQPVDHHQRVAPAPAADHHGLWSSSLLRWRSSSPLRCPSTRSPRSFPNGLSCRRTTIPARQAVSATSCAHFPNFWCAPSAMARTGMACSSPRTRTTST